jgi:hypothetical protein
MMEPLRQSPFSPRRRLSSIAKLIWNYVDLSTNTLRLMALVASEYFCNLALNANRSEGVDHCDFHFKRQKG